MDLAGCEVKYFEADASRHWIRNPRPDRRSPFRIAGRPSEKLNSFGRPMPTGLPRMEIAMRIARFVLVDVFAVIMIFGIADRWLLPGGARVVALAAEETANVAVGPQYDTAHVYVAPDDLKRFVASLLATFGGTASNAAVVSILPTASSCV